MNSDMLILFILGVGLGGILGWSLGWQPGWRAGWTAALDKVIEVGRDESK